MQTSRPVQLVNLACGNFIDVKTFPKYFPHPSSKVFGVDKILYQLAQSYHRHHFMELHAFDLFDETLQLKDFLGTKTHWIAIHACEELAFQIVDLWNEWSPSGSCLFLVPCCHFSKKQAISKVGSETWNRIRLETKQKVNQGETHKAAYINQALTTIRNSLLEKRSKWFRYSVQLGIPSVHNVGLFYEKDLSNKVEIV